MTNPEQREADCFSRIKVSREADRAEKCLSASLVCIKIEEVSFGKGRGDGHVDSKKNLYSDFCAKSGGVCDSKR